MANKVNKWAPEPGQLESVRDKLMSLHEDDEIAYTSCCANGCFDVCVLKCHLKDGKLKSIETDDTIHVGYGREDEYVDFEEFEKGMYQKRACPRGRGWRQDVYKKERILYPMKRVGEKGTRQFKRISWDEALDTYVENYLGIREKYGPYSVWCDGVFGSSLDPFAYYMPGGGLGGWGIDSFEPSDRADTFVFGETQNLVEISQGKWWGGTDNQTFFDSKLIVLWGFDAAVNYPETMYYLLLAKERGVPIVVIEPRYTWTASTLADQWIPIRPSTDQSMMEAMAYVMFLEDSYNHEYVEKFVEPVGFEKYRRYIMGEIDGEPKTPEWASEHCGVPAETIWEFARLYAASTPCYMRLVWAVARNIYGESVQRAMNYLNAMGGNVGVKGGSGIGSGFNVISHFPMPKLDFGDAYPEYQVKSLLETEEWCKAVVMHPAMEAGEISEAEYKALIGCPSYEPAPNIHMLFNSVSLRSQAVNYQDVNERIKALKMLDFVAIAHHNWANTTTWYADILFPLSHQFFEGGYQATGDYWGPFFTGLAPGMRNLMMASRKMIDGPGETRNILWVVAQLGERLGLGDKVKPRLNYADPKEFDKALEELTKEAYERWAADPEIACYNPKPWDEFIKQPVFRAPIEDGYYVKLKEEIDNGYPLKTDSGKIEFYSEFLADTDLTKVVHAGGKCFGKGHMAPYARYRPSPEGYESAKVNKYPLVMVTPHSYYRQHFWQDENPWFRDEYRSSVWISVPDAKDRGLKDGDMVVVENDVAQAVLPVYVTSRMTPGTCAMLFGRQYYPSDFKTEKMPEGIDMRGSCNLFLPNDHADDGRGALLDSALVEIRKADVSIDIKIVD